VPIIAKVSPLLKRSARLSFAGMLPMSLLTDGVLLKTESH
jgi:hypothetical protein